MERIARPAALLAAVMMIGVSLLLNFVFLASLGRDEHQGYVLGGVSLAADLMKALLPVLMAWAIARRRWVYVVAAAPIFALLVAFSASNAIGFAGQNRALTLGARDALSAEQSAVEQSLREVEAERARLPQHRAPSVVAELVAQAQQNRRFVATDSCKTVNAAPAREFCDGYFRLKAEHAAGVAARDVSTKIDGTRARLIALRAKGSAIEADPQARLIADLTGLAPDVARRWLVVLAAVVVEIGSAFGLYLATAYVSGGAGKAAPQQNGAPIVMVAAPSPSLLPTSDRSSQTAPPLEASPAQSPAPLPAPVNGTNESGGSNLRTAREFGGRRSVKGAARRPDAGGNDAPRSGDANGTGAKPRNTRTRKGNGSRSSPQAR